MSLDVATEMLLKFNAEGIHPAKQYLDAREQAVKAVDEYMEGKEEPMYCGYEIMPPDHEFRHTQSMDIKEVACDAFADALKKYGLRAYMESRAD